MSDLYGELYKASVINKLQLKLIESMAAVGNDAAHNVATLAEADVKRLVRDVREFVAQHPGA